MQVHDRLQLVTFAVQFRAGEPGLGLLVKAPAAASIELAAACGFDFVVIDFEHGPRSGLLLEDHLRAAAAAEIPVLVRVPGAGSSAIGAALDAGAVGIVVPHVRSPAEAASVVALAHYPPWGRRGLALSTRAGRYGTVDVRDHIAASRERTLVIAQIEDGDAVASAEDIAAVNHLDGIMIGTTDLSASLGRPGEVGHPEVTAAIGSILAAARRHRRTAVAVLGASGEAALWRAQGVDQLALVGTNLMRDAFRLAVLECGRDTELGSLPLLLLPGMLETAALWSEVVARLGPGVRSSVARIDLDDTVEEMALTVLAQAPRRFVLAGHSLGAIVALQIAREAPERVAGLALLNATGRSADDDQQRAWAAMERDAVGDGFLSALHDLASRSVAAGRGDDAALRERLVAMGRDVGIDGMRRQLAAQVRRPDHRDALPRIACPTLVVSGTEDRVSPPERQDELAETIPGATLVRLARCGHASPVERPDAVAAALCRWLERDVRTARQS